MIRPAAPNDRGPLMRFLSIHRYRYYPMLEMDPERAIEALTLAISSAKHFVWVAEDEGRNIRGALIALTEDNLWAKRKHSMIVVWLSYIAHDGTQLLRTYKKWVKERPGIKVAGFCPDCDVDPRALVLAERIGFKRIGGSYVFVNREVKLQEESTNAN